MATGELTKDLAAEYAKLLEAYLADGSATALRAAHDVGRRAIQNGMRLSELASMHHGCLASLARDRALADDLAWVRASAFFTELAGAVSHALRSYRESASELFHMNQVLEERTKEEVELREDLLGETRLLQSVLNCLGEGVAVADKDGHFLVFNPRAVELAGIGAVDEPPTEWSRAYGIFRADETTPFPPDELPLVRAIRGESVDEVEIFVRNANRPEGVHLLVTARPLLSITGDLAGGVAVFHEVPRRKVKSASSRRRGPTGKA